MLITYKNKKIQKICTNFSKALCTYGYDIAQKIHMRINEISAAPNIEVMIQFHIGRCHQLNGSRNGQYAVDLVHPYRLIFQVQNKTVQIANIIEVIDYH